MKFHWLFWVLLFNRIPLIEKDQESEIRSPQDIAKRILILAYLCNIADVEDDKFEIIEFLKKENLWASDPSANTND